LSRNEKAIVLHLLAASSGDFSGTQKLTAEKAAVTTEMIQASVSVLYSSGVISWPDRADTDSLLVDEIYRAMRLHAPE
jgi:hypothetical protein